MIASPVSRFAALLMRRLAVFLALLASSVPAAPLARAQEPQRANPPSQRAVVCDERFSALRAQPDVKAPLRQRLRRGRIVWILGAARSRNGGPQFYRVAVTRQTRGWIMAEAVARSGRAEDAERLLQLVNETNDDFIRARLARLCADEFRRTPAAPRALLALGEAAERAAERLSREARRRAGEEESNAGNSRRDHLLNHASLDRYNRLGITFDYDAAGERIVYDGEAYRELLRRYPRRAEAGQARQRLEKLQGRSQP
jgi:hypothetical protein